MEEKEIRDELAAIRGLMERSSKFISLSGLSGILAGVYSLIGEAVAYYYLYNGERRDAYNPHYYSFRYFMDSDIGQLIIIAIVILCASILTAYILSKRKAERKGQSVWGATSRSLLFHMFIPLLTGGLIIILLLYQGNFAFIVPVMLIFYGLALVSASNFTFTDVKYLGLLEIALGLVAACLPNYGLLFWAIGFGALHIIYGSMMYLKYDR